jgi:hypothetical protein
MATRFYFKRWTFSRISGLPDGSAIFARPEQIAKC